MNEREDSSFLSILFLYENAHNLKQQKLVTPNFKSLKSEILNS